MTCEVTGSTQNGVKSQKMEYRGRHFMYRTEPLYSCYPHVILYKVPWHGVRVPLLKEVLFV